MGGPGRESELFAAADSPVRIQSFQNELRRRCPHGIRFADAETKRAAMAAIREAEWANEPKPTVKVSPHPLFGRAR